MNSKHHNKHIKPQISCKFCKKQAARFAEGNLTNFWCAQTNPFFKHNCAACQKKFTEITHSEHPRPIKSTEIQGVLCGAPHVRNVNHLTMAICESCKKNPNSRELCDDPFNIWVIHTWKSNKIVCEDCLRPKDHELVSDGLTIHKEACVCMDKKTPCPNPLRWRQAHWRGGRQLCFACRTGESCSWDDDRVIHFNKSSCQKQLKTGQVEGSDGRVEFSDETPDFLEESETGSTQLDFGTDSDTDDIESTKASVSPPEIPVQTNPPVQTSSSTSSPRALTSQTSSSSPRALTSKINMDPSVLLKLMISNPAELTRMIQSGQIAIIQ